MGWYEKEYMQVGDRQIKKISDDGVRKAYWTSTPYVHCRPVPGAPEPVWVREEGRIASMIVWETTDIHFYTDGEAAKQGKERENVDFDQFFNDLDLFMSFPPSSDDLDFGNFGSEDDDEGDIDYDEDYDEED